MAFDGLLPFLLTPSQLTWKISDSRTDPRTRITSSMANGHSCDGSGHDGSRLDHRGTAGVSGTRPISRYLGCHPTFVPSTGWCSSRKL